MMTANVNQYGNPGSEDGLYFGRAETDDAVELKLSRQSNDRLQHRVKELERINIDLEYRLEEQAKQNVEIEHECMEIERKGRLDCEIMERKVLEWQNKYDHQEKKAARLSQQISRTERELYGAYQRKYELLRGTGGGGPGPGVAGGGMGPTGNGATTRRGGGRNGKDDFPDGGPSADRHPGMGLDSAYGSEASLSQLDGASRVEVKQRRLLSSLGDFLGLSP